MSLDHSAILYGPAPSPAPAAPDAAPEPEAKLDPAEALYGAKPGELDIATRNTYGPTMNAISSAADRLGMEPAELQDAAQGWAREFAAHNLPSNDSQDISEVAIGLRAGSFSDDAIESWQQQARADLRAEYGANYELALTNARKFVGTLSPEARQWLVDSPLGNHPRVVRAVARRAHALFKEGRL